MPDMSSIGFYILAGMCQGAWGNPKFNGWGVGPLRIIRVIEDEASHIHHHPCNLASLESILVYMTYSKTPTAVQAIISAGLKTHTDLNIV